MSTKAAKLLSDPLNVELLRRLVADPRVTTSELARSIGMSAPAVRERVQRLEEAGVIAGYRTEINPRALGYAVTVIVRVRPMPGRLPQIIELVQATPNVVECHRITGEDCFIMKAHLRCLDDLDGLLDRFLVHGQTTTSIVQSSPVPPRQLPLDADGGGAVGR
jgi:Lrp/AsnC family transcriptional regulator, leucine-responsive regulatory protein